MANGNFMQEVKPSGNEKRMISNECDMPTSCNSRSTRTPTKERESTVSPLHSPHLKNCQSNVHARGKTGSFRETSSQKQSYVVTNSVLLVISAHQGMDAEKNIRTLFVLEFSPEAKTEILNGSSSDGRYDLNSNDTETYLYLFLTVGVTEQDVSIIAFPKFCCSLITR